MTDSVLSLALRPKSWADLVGQETHVQELNKRFNSHSIPHFYIFSGPVGSGKTTFARILAIALQKDPTRFVDVTEDDYEKYKCNDIREINAANKTSIDDVRQLIQDMHYRPINGRCKIIILDEAHQLSKSAQDALLKDTEDTKDHVFIMFCTSALSKVSEALRSRACTIVMRPLGIDTTKRLLEKAAHSRRYQGDLTPLVNTLVDLSVTSPRWVLQAAEKYFCGISAQDSVLLTEGGAVETIGLCRAVASGNWKDCVPFVSSITRSEVTKMQASVLGYLQKMTYNASGDRLINICKAIDYMSRCPAQEHLLLPAFVASIGVACEYLKPVKRVASKAVASTTASK